MLFNALYMHFNAYIENITWLHITYFQASMHCLFQKHSQKRIYIFTANKADRTSGM